MLYLLVTAALLTVFAAANDICYRRTNYQVFPQNQGWFACNNTASTSDGAALCCINGSQCGPNSICRRADPEVTGEESRWYIGGCTDKNYKDPICSKHCSRDKQTWITYDESRDRWSCCGNDGCDESTPTDEHFIAVSPSEWSPDSKKDTSIDDDSDNFSQAAKIGIGVGVGVLIVLILLGILLWFRKGTRRSRQSHTGIKGSYEQISMPGRASSPNPRQSMIPPGPRALSPAPSRDVSPERSRPGTPQPKNVYQDEEPGMPSLLRPGEGDGPQPPRQLTLLSRKG